jgi:[acyl-carrier-protein] S-malonyltransferase
MVRRAAAAGGRAVTVAWVDGEPIHSDAVAEELGRLYGGPGGHALPTPGTAEGRQLRRWVVQVLAVRALLAAESARRGLPASGPLPDADRVALGSIAAAALARSPHAAAVFAAVTADVTVGAAEVAAYRAANPELAAEEVRVVRHVRAGRPVNGGRPYRLRHAEALGPLVFAATRGAVVTSGADVLEVLDSVETDGPDLAALLLAAARAAAFARWLDVQVRDRVRRAPGAEHPADPAQPDHTHRH